IAHVGADDSYGVYLAQMVSILGLQGLGWRHLEEVVPWPLLIALTVVLVFILSCLLTEVLARTSFAEALTGRKREPWQTLMAGWTSRSTAGSTPMASPDESYSAGEMSRTDLN